MTKVKGITIWELYVEYFVLGAVALVALAFVAMQFIGQPNAVERPPQGAVAPNDVDGLLESEAQRIRGLLSSGGVQREDPPAQLGLFEQRLAQSINPERDLGALFVQISPRPESGTRADVVYHAPSVPAPRDLIAMQYHDTLTEAAVEEHGLDSLFEARPYDVSWVTVAGIFDEKEALGEFKTNGPDGEAAIPSNWYFEQVLGLNVVVQRQVYRDGEWAEQVELDPIPGQFNLRDELAQEVESSRRDAIIRAARESDAQNQLLQPPFYETKSGRWVPPDALQVDAADGDVNARVRLLVRRRASRESEKQKIEERIEELRRRGSGGGGSGGGGAIGGGGGGIGGVGSGGGASAPGGPDPERQLEGLEQQLVRVERDLVQINREIDELIAQGAAEPVAPEGERTFWAHDLDVQPGETYRYRFVFEVFNPFCARKLNLMEEQHHLAESFVLRSEPSEWSEPITVEPPVRTFVTRVDLPRPGSGSNPISDAVASTTIEIYRFHDGQWRQQQFVLSPGQRVGTMLNDREDGATVDFGTEWFVLDIIPDPDASARDPRAARVILQHMRTNEVQERHPLWDAPDRERLRQRIELASRGPG